MRTQHGRLVHVTSCAHPGMVAHHRVVALVLLATASAVRSWCAGYTLRAQRHLTLRMSLDDLQPDATEDQRVDLLGQMLLEMNDPEADELTDIPDEDLDQELAAEIASLAAEYDRKEAMRKEADGEAEQQKVLARLA